MDAPDPVQVETADRSFLCLKCRSVGHIVNDCPLPTWSSEYAWFFSAERMDMKWTDISSSSQQKICRRCQELDILSLLHEEIPWKSSQDLKQAAQEGSNLMRSLGMTGSIQFKHDCPFCRCIFAMTPNPTSAAQEILIFPDWTINRLSGNGGTDMDTEETLQYAKCLLVALRPSQLESAIWGHAGDALCIMEADDADYATTLGGRLIESHSLNTDVVEEWLSTCLQLHGRGCTPVYTENLQGIRLIDVVEPRKVINYPERGCEYVALSYVWGGVVQKSFRPGSILPRLPQTIEDAIACVRSLGKRYLWVDSVCIDQLDAKEKRDQIGRMSSVYRGAYITLIALSCSSAETGLPRFASRRPSCSQLRCHIGGQRLVGLMPTLSQHIVMSAWGSRAWTLQEALLSPRCLYLSDHQLYFECNVMQCCESLDQTRSWAHNLACDPNCSQKGSLSWMMTQHGPGCLKNALDSHTEGLLDWGLWLNQYSCRTMTKTEDALNAFSGILECLKFKYKDGFFWGLPVADFQWGLLWQLATPPTRREGFPTWSWAGWKGVILPSYPLSGPKLHEFPVHLQIKRMSEGRLVEVFSTTQAVVEGSTEVGSLFHSDPIGIAETYESQSLEFNLSLYPRAKDNAYLFVEAIVLRFIPDYSRPLRYSESHRAYKYLGFSIGDTISGIRIVSTDREINRSEIHTEQQFLLLARERDQGLVYYHLLLVYPRGNLVERGAVIELAVPEDRLEVLDQLNPQKQRVVMC